MEPQSKVGTISAGALLGYALGATTGVYAGTKKTATTLGSYAKYVGLDRKEYVKLKRHMAAERFIREGGMSAKDKEMKTWLDKVAQKAKEDYPIITEKIKELQEKARQTNNRYIIGFAVAGTLIGTAIGFASAAKIDDSKKN